MGHTVLFVYDRSERSARALTSLVRAVARAEKDGMPVNVEASEVSATTVAQVPSVQVDDLIARGTDVDAIYDAIARAHAVIHRRRSP